MYKNLTNIEGSSVLRHESYYYFWSWGLSPSYGSSLIIICMIIIFEVETQAQKKYFFSTKCPFYVINLRRRPGTEQKIHKVRRGVRFNLRSQIWDHQTSDFCQLVAVGRRKRPDL